MRQPTKSIIWTPESTDDNYQWITDSIAVGMEPPNSATVKKIIGDGSNNFLCLHRKDPAYNVEDFNINFKQIKIADGELISLKQAKEGIDFIRNAIENNEKVFVHCEMGVSRSAMMVILYFIAYHRMNFTDALTKVMEKRPVINPSEALINFDLIIDLKNYYMER
jgi:hypothetical protein